jgi:hypothetical protein
MVQATKSDVMVSFDLIVPFLNILAPDFLEFVVILPE